MKVVGILIVAMALVVGIVPQFTYCKFCSVSPTMSMAGSGAATGTGATMASTATAPMPCYWTARAALGLAPVLCAAGVLLFFSRRKETRRALAVLISVLGLVAILLPTVLIGVCATAGAACNTIMRPSMVAAGGIAVALGLITLVTNELRADRGTASRQAAG